MSSPWEATTQFPTVQPYRDYGGPVAPVPVRMPWWFMCFCLIFLALITSCLAALVILGGASLEYQMAEGRFLTRAACLILDCTYPDGSRG